MEKIIFILLLLTLLTSIGVLISRHKLLKKLNGLMHSNSKFNIENKIQLTEVEKVQPALELVFFEINVNTNNSEATKLRESLVKQAKKIFWNSTLVDVLAGILFLVFTVVAATIYNSEWYVKRFISGQPVDDDSVAIGFFIGFFIILLSILRYMVFQNQFRATGKGLLWTYAKGSRSFNGFFLSPKYSLNWVVFFILLAIIAVIINTSNAAWLIRFALLSASALYIVMLIQLFKSYRKGPNRKLLILRVFGINNTSKFTFDGIWKYWQHFGSFFTVVDKSFLHSQTKIWGRVIVLMILLSLMGGYYLDHNDSADHGPIFLLSIVVSIFLIRFMVSIVSTTIKFNKSIVGNKELFKERLEVMYRRPKKLSLTFREMSFVCYDNVWKMVVEELVQVADTILMDLRGFTEERKGCEQEVGLLLDTVPLTRLTFLVERGDLSPVKNLIQNCWKSVSSTSPNLTPEQPKVIIYVASEKNDEDIQGIMDILLNAALVSKTTNAMQNAK